MAAPVVPGVPEPRVKQEGIPGVNADPAAFGAPQARALTQLGGGLADLGDAAANIAIQEQERKTSTMALDASNKISDGYRNALYNPENGIMTRQGSRAMGASADVTALGEKLYADATKGVTDPRTLDAIKKMSDRQARATKDAVAQLESRETIAYQNDTVKATYGTAVNDFVDANGNEALEKDAYNRGLEALKLQSRTAGDPPQVLAQKVKEFTSSARTGVISRLLDTDPEKAVAYREKHRADISGKDNIAVDRAMEQPLLNMRVKTQFQTITGRTPSMVRLAGVVAGLETTGGANVRTSSAGASGIMQVMPNTARYVAKKLNDSSLDGLDDKQIQDLLNKDTARASRYGIAYLSEQNEKYKGDVDAILIAYNAGPGVADKWLDAGRDNSVLPKETQKYVADGKAAWSGAGGLEVQTRDRRVSAVAVDASLSKMLATGKDVSHVAGLSPQLKTGFAAMMADMPAGMRDKVKILSGFRDENYQARIISGRINSYVPGAKAEWDADVAKLGAVAAGEKWRPKLRAAGLTKWIGMPGGSDHGGGNALDMGWGGQLLGDKRRKVGPDEQQAVDWVHANAEKYGLHFPMGHEAWHVSPTEKGKRGEIGNAGPAAYKLAVTPATVMAYGGEMRVPQRVQIDPEDWQSQADAAFDPGTPQHSRLSSMLRGEAARIGTESKKALAETRSLLMKDVLAGKAVSDMPASALDAIDGPTLDKLYKIEESVRKRGEPETDAGTYYRITKMNEDEFKSVDLYEYRDSLSNTDFKSLADRQGTMMRQDDSGKAANAGLRSREQIVSRTLQTLDLNPERDDDDAKRALLLERSFDAQIQRHQAETGKPATSLDMQKMMDTLLIESRGRGALATGILGVDKRRLFEVEADKATEFVAAGSPSDIPPEAKVAFGRRFAAMNNGAALDVETELVPLYNLAVQAYNTESVPFPRETPQGEEFLTKLSQRMGRAPSPNEQAKAWNLYLRDLLSTKNSGDPRPSAPMPRPSRSN